MRVLITGGAGFIGSHLCESLLENKHEVICLDNLFSSSKDNVHHLRDWRGFEFMRHDVIHPLFVEVERIFNLACPASPVHYQYNPVKTVKTNVMGTLNMLGLAKRVRARILQASTSEVYGDPEVHPQNEKYWGSVNPIGLRSCYDEGKRVAETLMMDYHRQNNVDVRIARIFNTYGPRMSVDDGRVVSNFVVQAMKGEPLTVYGEGTQTRSFCFVSDMVAGLNSLMDSEGPVTPVNLGNAEEVRIVDVAKLIKDLMGSRSEIRFKPLPDDDPVRRKPDTSLAKRALGWEPSVPLREGLQKTIEYFEQVLSTSDSEQ
jgi:UDP-glucuronate decarboxylase